MTTPPPEAGEWIDYETDRAHFLGRGNTPATPDALCSTSPLSKTRRDDPRLTERFELFIYGMEIANGFSELNDPLDQKARFEKQEDRRSQGDLEAQMIDYDYIRYSFKP
jgi:elongation factor P--beta-lysine ligase